MAARVFANPSESGGVSKVEIAWFSWLFWLIGLRRRAKVELDELPFGVGDVTGVMVMSDHTINYARNWTDVHNTL
jgi:hypothetical protein